MTNKPRAAVIGSGFGGLATAIRLQASGFDVTVFEKRDLPGGRAYVYRDGGFTFDAGPTVVTAPECLTELFEAAGRDMRDYVELMPVAPLYRLYWENGFTFDYSNDLEETLEQIRRKSPGDTEGYKKFLAYSEKVFDEGYTKLAHVPFLDWWSMIRVAPQLVKLESFRSVYAMVSRFIRDPQLREAFSFHSLLVGGNPFRTSAIYTLIHFLERKWGVFFPKGGTGALVRGMVQLFEDIGGKIRYDSDIDEILVETGRVTGVSLASGEKLSFDAVVSNADVARTYGHLLRRDPSTRPRARALEKADYSMSLFVMYFGTNRRYPGLAHHNVLFGPRYKELLDDIFVQGELAEDFSLYLHAPTVTDPSLAPQGCEAFYVLSPVPHLGKADIDWEEMGPRYGDKILKYLEERYLPGLRESIVTRRHFTPLDFKRELGAHLGSAFSLEPLLTQSAYFRVHNRDPHVRGLYFAGAGTHPGAGIPGVVSSAKATAGLMAQDLAERRILALPTSPPPLPAVRTPAVEGALTQCREMIRVGSKSFSLAARLFEADTRDAAFFLYGWCRYCDDQIDATMNRRLQEERLGALRKGTERAFAGQPDDNPVYVALAYVARKYRIPAHYALELIEGMAMDVRKERYWQPSDLSLYCYRVAGTVGLMMSHVMGVSDQQALRHASDLGIAMQMTNIARDVLEDAKMGRVYLPLAWLDEAGVPEGQIELARHRGSVAWVVERLLTEADTYYASGISGLRFLPWRSAIAVGAAARVYSEIGRQVRARGANAWDSRTVVSTSRKLASVLEGAGLATMTLPYRLFKPFAPVHIETIWRHA